jgi:hypothetical protein
MIDCQYDFLCNLYLENSDDPPGDSVFASSVTIARHASLFGRQRWAWGGTTRTLSPGSPPPLTRSISNSPRLSLFLTFFIVSKIPHMSHAVFYQSLHASAHMPPWLVSTQLQQERAATGVVDVLDRQMRRWRCCEQRPELQRAAPELKRSTPRVAAGSTRRCYYRRPAMLPSFNGGRRCYYRRPAVLLPAAGDATLIQRRPAMLLPAPGGATTGGRRCYYRCPAVLLLAAGDATLIQRWPAMLLPAVLPPVSDCASSLRAAPMFATSGGTRCYERLPAVVPPVRLISTGPSPTTRSNPCLVP